MAGHGCWKYNFWICIFTYRFIILSAKSLETIIWSSQNPKFQQGKGLVIYPHIGDKVDMICPKADVKRPYEYYKLYLVKKEQAEDCTTVLDPNVLINCNKPEKDIKFTIKFQEFSPNYMGLEFKNNINYYITSTSNISLEGLDNREGGVCKTHSMKVIMKVGQDPNATVPDSEQTEGVMIKAGVNVSNESNRPLKAWNTETTDENPDDTDEGILGSTITVFSAIGTGCFIFLILIIFLIVLLIRIRKQSGKTTQSRPASLTLNTLTSPNIMRNVTFEPTDTLIPLQTENTYCPHYERMNGDYDYPVYIFQEMSPQSLTNIYYKV